MRLLALVPLLLQTPEALACGGFFCSQQPVLQTAERVVFEIEGTKITAYVQLQYQGNDPNFAWIVPVPEAPEVEVGIGQEMFSILEEQTKPLFISSSTAAGVPQADAALLGPAGCGFTGGFGEPNLSVNYVPVPEVDVWKNEQVGPFEVVTLSAESAEDLNNWLRQNGYRVAQGSDPIVQAYLDQGMKLLALKLAPEVDSTAIEPIKLTYHDSRGCAAIPMKLTAIAAVPNLEVVTWVFGESRAAPINFAAAEVTNERLFEASDYPVELAEAVDRFEGGRAFVTEYASNSEKLLAYGNPIVAELIEKHGYVTRLRTYLDPREMTEDPDFDTDAPGGDVAREVRLRAPPQRMSVEVFVVLALAAFVILRRRS